MLFRNTQDTVKINSVSYRRRAIYTGLAPFLEQEERLLIMNIWQKKYSNQPAYALNKFLSEICEFLKGKCSRGEINQKLVWALGQPEESLEKDPLELMETYSKRFTLDNIADKEFLPHEIVFESMYTLLLRDIDTAEYGASSKTIRALLDKLPALELDTKYEDVEAWILTKSKMTTRILNRDQMHAIIHEVYVSACKICGPVAADKIMSAAVRETELLPEAKLFSPTRFT